MHKKQPRARDAKEANHLSVCVCMCVCVLCVCVCAAKYLVKMLVREFLAFSLARARLIFSLSLSLFLSLSLLRRLRFCSRRRPLQCALPSLTRVLRSLRTPAASTQRARERFLREIFASARGYGARTTSYSHSSPEGCCCSAVFVTVFFLGLRFVSGEGDGSGAEGVSGLCLGNFRGVLSLRGRKSRRESERERSLRIEIFEPVRGRTVV